MSILDDFKLDGKVAYVTGGAQGIGEQFALGLAEAGADVAIVDINHEKAEKTANSIADATGRIVKAFKVDVTDPTQAEQMIQDIVDEFGSLDIAFNNAGMSHNAPAEELSVEKWQAMIDLNLNGIFYTTQAAGRYMIEHGGGSIVNTGSMSGHVVNVPQPQAHYNASKAGVIQLTKSFAVEWAEKNVRVNSISPGYMGTDLIMKNEALAPLRDQWSELTPFKRIGDPKELKGAAIYLASDASPYTSGTDIVVDGGYTAV